MIYQTFVPAATVLLQYEGSLTEMKRQKKKRQKIGQKKDKCGKDRKMENRKQRWIEGREKLSNRIGY